MTLPATLPFAGREVLLKYHKFSSGVSGLPKNSLPALDEVLTAAVQVVEFDIGLLRDGSFAVLHDGTLERETTGAGRLSAIDTAGLKELMLRGSSERPATLNEVVERLRAHQKRLKVQVDLKEGAPLDDEAALTLIDALSRLRENPYLRVVVGCLADWNLRLLRRLDPLVNVGFDPALYLHAPTAALSLPLPTRLNAYGYVDDHPLGFRGLMPAARYLLDRMEALVQQVPGSVEFYLHKTFVLRALEDGFNPIHFLKREAGCLVDVWTINEGDDAAKVELTAVLEAGADQITTDTPVALTDMVEL